MDHNPSVPQTGGPHARALKTLKGALHGRVVEPGHKEFDTSRALFYSWNERRPAFIVKAADDHDVAQVIRLARELELELAIRSGGHSLAGHSTLEGGVVLDLSELRSMEIDLATCTAWAGAGLTAGEYTNRAAAHGLATGFGDTPSVGIGGLTLGGGIGFLVRKHGMTIDNLLAADIVTADGSLLHLDTQEHPELFWAIRGGGGNFGVVTRFKFHLSPVDQVYGGMLILPANAQITHDFFAEAGAAPNDLSVIAAVMKAPPMPFVPKEAHGKLIIFALVMFAGDPGEGEQVVGRLRAIAKPLADMVRPIRYPQIYEGEGPHPAAASVRSMFLDAVDMRTAGAIMEHVQRGTAPMAVAQLRTLGGVMADVPAEATAFAHRDRKLMANLAALYERPDESPVHEEWVDAFMAAIRQGEPGVYVNFLGNEGPSRLREAYPGTTWGRLCAVKKQYDPTNFFRMNHNIPVS